MTLLSVKKNKIKKVICGEQESFVYIFEKKNKEKNLFLHQSILARPYFMSILQWETLEIVSKEEDCVC